MSGFDKEYFGFPLGEASKMIPNLADILYNAPGFVAGISKADEILRSINTAAWQEVERKCQEIKRRWPPVLVIIFHIDEYIKTGDFTLTKESMESMLHLLWGQTGKPIWETPTDKLLNRDASPRIEETRLTYEAIDELGEILRNEPIFDSTEKKLYPHKRYPHKKARKDLLGALDSSDYGNKKVSQWRTWGQDLLYATEDAVVGHTEYEEKNLIGESGKSSKYRTLAFFDTGISRTLLKISGYDNWYILPAGTDPKWLCHSCGSELYLQDWGLGMVGRKRKLRAKCPKCGNPPRPIVAIPLSEWAINVRDRALSDPEFLDRREIKDIKPFIPREPPDLLIKHFIPFDQSKPKVMMEYDFACEWCNGHTEVRKYKIGAQSHFSEYMPDKDKNGQYHFDIEFEKSRDRQSERVYCGLSLERTVESRRIPQTREPNMGCCDHCGKYSMAKPIIKKKPRLDWVNELDEERDQPFGKDLKDLFDKIDQGGDSFKSALEILEEAGEGGKHEVEYIPADDESDIDALRLIQKFSKRKDKRENMIQVLSRLYLGEKHLNRGLKLSRETISKTKKDLVRIFEPYRHDRKKYINISKHAKGEYFVIPKPQEETFQIEPEKAYHLPGSMPGLFDPLFDEGISGISISKENTSDDMPSREIDKRPFIYNEPYRELTQCPRCGLYLYKLKELCHACSFLGGVSQYHDISRYETEWRKVEASEREKKTLLYWTDSGNCELLFGRAENKDRILSKPDELPFAKEYFYTNGKRKCRQANKNLFSSPMLDYIPTTIPTGKNIPVNDYFDYLEYIRELKIIKYLLLIIRKFMNKKSVDVDTAEKWIDGKTKENSSLTLGELERQVDKLKKGKWSK